MAYFCLWRLWRLEQMDTIGLMARSLLEALFWTTKRNQLETLCLSVSCAVAILL